MVNWRATNWATMQLRGPSNFKGFFLKTHWPFDANTSRVEYDRRVLLSHEVLSPNEFPMSFRLLVRECKSNEKKFFKARNEINLVHFSLVINLVHFSLLI